MSEDISSSEPLKDLSGLDLAPQWVSDLAKGGSAVQWEQKSEGAKKTGSRGGQRKKGTRSHHSRERNHSRDRRQDDREGGGRRPAGKGFQKGRGKGRDGGRDRRTGRDDRRGHEDVPVPKGLRVRLYPEKRGMEALSEMIRKSGRVYPLMDLIKLVLAGRERYEVGMSFGKTEGENEMPVGQFYQSKDGFCALEKEAVVQHLLGSKLLQDWYGVEKKEVDPPKGNFNVVAVCGMSGTLIGPPNHHSFPVQVAKLHRERFAHMSLSDYKLKIRHESDEELVEKWKQQASVQLVYHFPKQDETVKPAEGEGAQGKDEEKATREAEETESTSEAGADVPTDEDTGEGEVIATQENADLQPDAVENPDTQAQEADTPKESTSEGSEEIEGSSESDQASVSAERDGSEDSDQAGGEQKKEPAGEAGAEASGPDVLYFQTVEERNAHARKEVIPKLCMEPNHLRLLGDVQFKRLTPPLVKAFREGVQRVRDVPTQMVASMCGLLEKQGLKVFRLRGKKLMVGRVKPKAMAAETVFTDSIQDLVAKLEAQPGATVQQLLGRARPEKKATPKQAQENQEQAAEEKKEAAEEEKPLNETELAILKDLMWLVSEGYVIEFSNGKLHLTHVYLPKEEKKEVKETVAVKNPTETDIKAEEAQLKEKEPTDEGAVSKTDDANAAANPVEEVADNREESETSEA